MNESTTSVAVTDTSTSDIYRIKVHGRLCADTANSFIEAIHNIDGQPTVQVDLGASPSIDSHGLGLLLMLSEHLHTTPRHIEIINCNTEVKTILDFAQLGMPHRPG